MIALPTKATTNESGHLTGNSDRKHFQLRMYNSNKDDVTHS